MARASFTETTRRILAQRAAYRCSSPNCNRLTIGPGAKDNQIENTGKAAHIFSASKGGPRGQATLTTAQLKSPTNGIWMCGHHADLIDKNSGKRFPAPVIKSWKALHEHRIAYEHSGGNSAFGFVRSIDIETSALFVPGTRLELAKTTFLIGRNESGKSAICEWLSSIDSLQLIRRWIKPTPLKFAVTFDAPIERTLSIETGTGRIHLHLDGVAASTNHHRVSVAFLGYERETTSKNDLDLLCRALRLDDVSVGALAELIANRNLFIQSARFEREKDDDGEWQQNLYCTLQSGAEVSFAGMSSGERGRVLLDFAIAQMQSASDFAPALLIVEWPGLSIDSAGLEKYAAYFSSADCKFQTLITMLERTPRMDAFGWQMYETQLDPNTQLRRIDPIIP